MKANNRLQRDTVSTAPSASFQRLRFATALRAAPEAKRYALSISRSLMKYLKLSFLTLTAAFLPMERVLSQPDYASYCQEFSSYFIAGSSGPDKILAPEKIDGSKLDYSMESLKVVDDYLTHIHINNENLNEAEVTNTVVWGGCYIGETIRKHSEKKFKWENYYEYVLSHPEVKSLVPFSPGTIILLVDDRDTMTLPLNKVGRFIYEGVENNIHFYASGELKYRP